MIKRVLFIMLDQMRRDHLSCYGHPAIRTPHIDALAARGLRFERAYVQGTSCGNSRASYYTGRHVRSHGATWNDVPFDLGEWTLADYMKSCGLPTVLLGKTHMRADSTGLERLGIDPRSELGRFLASAGFAVGERHDGLYGTGPDGNYHDEEPRYHDWLRERGFGGANPWQDWANAVDSDRGEILSANFMQHARRASRLPAEFSETAYMTDRAIEFIDQSGDEGWCLHLSYIKPHWPYVAPDPYHAMYGPQDILPVVRHDRELVDPHPVYQAFTRSRWSTVWNKPQARETVVPAYMGMIGQIDDQIGRLTAHLAARGLLDSTLIALTADHGDYLGDHWLGEKDLF
ncbi:MAG: sulfatase-like hydrolase/transferase, partial [Burkholderiaceae bacterium]